MALLEANAVVGLVARNVRSLNGKLDINSSDIYAGESLGLSCAFCHGITDGSVLKTAKGGSIGKRVDGPTAHNLQVGKSLALARNSRAYYPTLALKLIANGGKSVSRLGPSVGLISAEATEAEVDAYLNNPKLYPVGMFDDAIDGNGAPMHITPMFRADLAAPWGSEGSIEQLQNFSNLVYTALFDPTDILLPGGLKFLSERGGKAGLEIAANYEKILASSGIQKGGKNGYPFVARQENSDVTLGLPAGAKVENSPIGLRVNETKLIDLNGYFNSLRAPLGDKSNPAAIATGQKLFVNNCTQCHNASPTAPVPSNIVAYNSSVDLYSFAPARPALWPGYEGRFVADRSAVGLAPVRNSEGTFDDKLIVVEASNRNQPRGSAFPLLLDLARKPTFLHDDSVGSLDELLNPTRGSKAPHPFYFTNNFERAQVVSYLRSLDDR